MRSQIKALESRKDMTLPYEIFISILALVAVGLSFSSLAQFGYEDVELMSLPGKIVVGITGICFTGMFTATMATYYLKLKMPKETVENKIIDLSDLSEEQFKEVVNFISFTRAKG